MNTSGCNGYTCAQNVYKWNVMYTRTECAHTQECNTSTCRIGKKISHMRHRSIFKNSCKYLTCFIPPPNHTLQISNSKRGIMQQIQARCKQETNSFSWYDSPVSPTIPCPLYSLQSNRVALGSPSNPPPSTFPAGACRLPFSSRHSSRGAPASPNIVFAICKAYLQHSSAPTTWNLCVDNLCV